MIIILSLLDQNTTTLVEKKCVENNSFGNCDNLLQKLLG